MKTGMILLLNLFLLTSFTTQNNSREITDKMIRAINNVSTLKYKLKSFERLTDGKYKSSEQDVKYGKNPFRYYIYSIKPDKGAEVLYNSQVNKKDVLVNPNAFPYVNVYLSPYSSVLRKNRHHTSFDVGFDYFAGIVNYLVKESGAEIEDRIRIDGEVRFNNRDCYKLVMNYPEYKHVDYVVKKGETVTSIAKKLFVSDYKILELNKSVAGYDDVQAGKTIKVPNLYAKSVVVYIDKKNLLPIMQEMHDEKGMYERFEFLDLQLNPTFQQNEFTKDFKDYHF